MTGLPDPADSRALTIRVHSASAETPDVFPVESTLDDIWPVQAGARLQLDGLPKTDPAEYGRQLGQALFASPTLQRQFNFARGRGPHVSISLQVDADELAGVAWERLIYVGGGEELPLATAAEVALTRRVPSELIDQPQQDGPFRLLLVLASPSSLTVDGPIAPIDLAAEVHSLRRAWDAQVGRGLMDVTILGRLPEALAVELGRDGYRVRREPATLATFADLLPGMHGLHLISHGAFKNGGASLLWEDEQGGATIVTELDFLPKVRNSTLRLVFLQACRTAAGASNAMSGLAPQVAARSAAVVAMQDYVRMDDASRFAEQFYDTLLTTGYVDRAVNAGRQALFTAAPGTSNWAIPCLYLAPKAARLWRPDQVLRAVQDLADRFRALPEISQPFPVEVIRLQPGESPRMETSPPGPRVRVLDAVAAALETEGEGRAQSLVIAGNYGRAKTSQLRSVYASHARLVSRDATPLPLYLQANTFPLDDDLPEQLLARGIEATYAKFGVALTASDVIRRLGQPCLLCVDGDDGADGRRLLKAFESVRAFTQARPQAAAVVTLDIEQLAAIRKIDPAIPVMVVQLMSPATVTQYLTALAAAAGDTPRQGQLKELLASIQRANLYDVASVPWLLSYLIRHAARGLPSRSMMIGRIVEENFAQADLPAGVRRLIHDLFGRLAWHLQSHQTLRIDGGHLYELLDQVRGRREWQLEDLKAAALKTRILAPSDEDGARFCYPGFQSYYCARYLLSQPDGLALKVDDITATLGRRARVRLWEDTLVLLAGMIEQPDDLVTQVLAGSGSSHAEPAFLAARCLHEAALSKREVGNAVTTQVLDNLVWRSTPRKESSSAVRIRATEALSLLRDPVTIPHLFSIGAERVRPSSNGGRAEFELSGLRHAAIQVLLTMPEETAHFVEHRAASPSAGQTERALKALIDRWVAGDCDSLRTTFRTTAVDGLPAIVAFALATIGGDENLAFLSDEIMNPQATDDTRWSIADSLLHFNPAAVSRGPIARMRAVPDLHPIAAYLIGRLRVATPESTEVRFLNDCLTSASPQTRGVALRALAQLGDDSRRELSQAIVTGDWDQVTAVIGPVKPHDQGALRYNALESLRLIGDKESLEVLRRARLLGSRSGAYDTREGELMQLSYEVSEDVYWRVREV